MATGIEHVLPVLGRLGRPGPPIDLVAVGRAIALSPSHAQRTIRRLVGESPDRYQRRLRLERAAAQLLSTDDTVLDIALAVGFDSHEAFTRAFTRHYGVPPRRYRSRVDGRLDPDQAQRVVAVGPCIRVLPATIAPRRPRPDSENPMSYTIERVELSATPLLYIPSRVDRDQIADVLGQSLPAVFGHVMAAGLAMAGPPVVRYLDHSPAFVSLEAGIPLAEAPPAPPADTGILVGELPAGPAASTIHVGPYETIGGAHEALDRWMAEEGVTSGGSPWEVYLTDPAEVPDPAQWQTQVLWPLAG